MSAEKPNFYAVLPADEALDKMREWLEENQAIADYVYGADNLSNDTSA